MKNIIIPFLSIVVNLVFISCGSSSFRGLSTLQEELGMNRLPEQTDYSDEDGVILLQSHDTEMDLRSNYFYTYEKVHNVTKLFKNIDKWSTIEIPIYYGQTLENINARTIKPDGTILELKKDDIYKIKGESSGHVFYTDKEEIKFTFPGAEKNCIIEYNYTIRNNFPFVQDVWFIQYPMPVLKNEYKLTVPVLLLQKEALGGAGWSWRYKPYNISLDPPQ
jgi:hypothetical protein